MGRYEDESYNGNSTMNRQRDLVLSVNEFCFLQNKTDGSIKSHVGPTTITISQQETLVYFDSKSKKFVETSNFDQAKQLFISAPEGWYVILKNPTTDNRYPETGKANITPSTMVIGKKINISGPTSFALYPGQMAKVIRGHRLRSNQYLLARVYDAVAAQENSKSATVIDAEGNKIEQNETYHVGQLLVIKGTDVSFYIPPTGIEVIPIGEKGNKNAYTNDDFVRDAVTLERLEYAILKDEDGEKRYVHGPAVVFPKPTETFVTATKGSVIFRALELSPISGIYVKVIAAYTDEKGVNHPVGEELFITGKDQMIYYPRPEHAMIQYDGKYMHHAIAIPEGEGRYILNRLTGVITTIVGPQMYLPDPRTEVVVKRKLSDRECALIYPGNNEVLAYNKGLSEKVVERLAAKGLTASAADRAINSSAKATALDTAFCFTDCDVSNSAYATSNATDTLAIFEAGSNVSRGTSYTKPRTITLDTKYDGVVAINVWTGYAVNVVSKSGKRDVVVGPTTKLLNYDETLEGIELSTGRPKTTDKLIHTAYLRTDNNKVTDIIEAKTSDFVNVRIMVSYCVNFLKEYQDKWFSVSNYVKHLCDKEKSLIKAEIQNYTIESFYNDSTSIIKDIALDNSEDNKYGGLFFKENGMLVYDVEVLTVEVDAPVAKMLSSFQEKAVRKALELTDAAKNMEKNRKLAEYDKEQAKLVYDNDMYKANLDAQSMENKLANQLKEERMKANIKEAETQAQKDLQNLINEIEAQKRARLQEARNADISYQTELQKIEAAKQEAYANTVKEIMSSISDELVAAMTSSANADLMKALTANMSPYAIAQGKESVTDVTTRLLRGTPIEECIKAIKQVENENN